VEKIFTDQNLMLVANVQNLLSAEGIVGELRNTYASGASGSLAFTEVWPELWIDGRQVIRAKELLQQISEKSELAWHCSRCDEESPGNFDYCWHCGDTAPKLAR
jgi:hypothetical protein